jgi:hypothetical protein
MVTQNVAGISLRSLHAYLGFKYKVYQDKMQDGNIKGTLGEIFAFDFWLSDYHTQDFLFFCITLTYLAV